MIKTPLVLLLSLSGLYSVSTHAAPTRTHCLCSSIPAAAQPPTASPPISDELQHQQSQSHNHDLLQDSQILSDPCASLGPQLESLKNSAPEVYAQYFPADVPTPSLNTEEKPVATSALLALAARNGYAAPEILPRAQESSSSTEQAIVCRSAPVLASELRFSKITLVGLQCLVAMAVLGCISECISVVGQWWSTNEQERGLQLNGDEQRLRAFVVPVITPEPEMKMRVPPNAVLGEEEENDEDDEMNRPVL
ncbi:hypothetical protein K491DRAFT_689377 [Lophiostoma macrostomum CBS 122681]|uniref:Ig-like domain-containing protein n=1 Tax=Lophiostoma macrostomum CBS 122681 TaxID=1314788 RepID=A0A6A6TIK1_9PLEO|nr:hypothetical protein K491DRAFT_689377 [Lophiostoma macrostomum CBS 122681]